MTTLQWCCARFDARASDPSPIVCRQAGRVTLSRLLADMGCRRGAEIGVWKGKWSAWLCRDNPRLDLLCVDPWQTYDTYVDNRNEEALLEQAHRVAVEHLSRFPRATIVRKPSLVAAQDVPDGSLDFVHIDANHGEAFVTADLEAWIPKVRSGGLICGHDYIYRADKPNIQVKAAVDRYVKAHRIAPLFVLAADTVPSFAWVNP